MLNRDFTGIWKAADLSPAVQSHVVHVYQALAATVLMASCGAMLHMQTHLGGICTAIASMLTLGWLGRDQDNENETKRMSILLLFGLFKGMTVGGIVEAAMIIDPALVLIALVATTTVFVCFSLAALVAKRRSYLYLGGILGSAIAIMTLASLANLYFRSPWLMNVNLYGGLVVFSGYVVLDTQLIIEKADLGSRDFAWHAAELFVNFMALFVRVLIILMKNAEKKNKRGRNGR
ncbi:unnamed protein product [Chrysoparadoxa australica]